MNIEEINKWADFWRYEIGANVIPANTKVKKPQAGIFWTEWKDAPISEAQHSEWKKTNKFKDGMAVITGKTWHNEKMKDYYLVCIDLDNTLAVEQVIVGDMKKFASKTIVEMHLDNTSKVHVYFYSPTPVKPKSSDNISEELANKIKLNEIPAIEVKCGTLMYCTPSMHKDGHRYEIIDCKTPRVATHIETTLDGILKPFDIAYLDDTNSKAMTPMTDLKKDECVVLKGHNRHEALLRYIDSLMINNQDMTDEIITKLALEKDERMNKPSLASEYGEKEIAGMIDQCRRWTGKQIEKLKSTIIDINSLPRPQTPAGAKVKQLTHDEIATKLQEEYWFRTLEETDEVLWYYEGMYIRGGEIQIKKQCERMLENCTTAMVNEVINTIRRRTYISIKRFDADPIMVNLKNCWLNITDGKTSEHSHEKLSLAQINVFYSPDKISKRFNKFLRECHKDPKVVYQLWESFASCLIKSPKFNKAFMLIGMGANGKSVYLKVINSFLGFENVSNMSIHTIEYNRFAPAQLYSKFANIYADISSEELRETSNFKNIVGGDNITAEKKGKDPFEFVAFAKMFFSANQIPKVFDESDGFYRRFIVTEWNKQFTKMEQNPNLIHELTTDSEKSGILNVLIAMARELDKRGHFKYDTPTEHVRTQWKKKSDSVSAFNEECMVFDPLYMIDKNRYYEKYIDYCRHNKIPPITRKRDFQDEVKNGTPLEDDGKPVRVSDSESWAYLKDVKEKNKLKRVWRGGMLKADIPSVNGALDIHVGEN